MRENYPKAYKEVLEILKYFPDEKVSKIPENIIEVFKKNKDDNYVFGIDESKELDEQIVLDETKAIFANLFRDYWATEEQRNIIIDNQNYQRFLYEEEKRKRYNNIFENKMIEERKKADLIPVKSDNYIRKIINFFVSLFKKK